MDTWLKKITEYGCERLFIDPNGEQAKHPFSNLEWSPTDKDRSAAWALYTQMRTRITTQPLAYRHGDEETALTSVFQLFGMTRSAIAEHEGCTHFATLAVHVLNVHIRPFTAYWHKVKVAGRFSSSDTCHRFRRELINVQIKLRVFMRLLGYLAEGDDFIPKLASGIESSPVYTDYDLGESIPFGVNDGRIPIRNAEAIDEEERAEVVARRETYALPSAANDAVGLALSGGGIRSATFSLGVVQNLARRGILKQVDFLSTVSGGGYLGSFLSSYLNDPNNPKVGLDPDSHAWPFGKTDEVESKAVRHLRNHSKYLAEGGFKTYALAIGQMIYGILLNLFMILPFVLLAVIVASYSLDTAFVDAARHKFSYPPALMSTGMYAVLLVLAVSVLILPFVQNLGRNISNLRPLRRWYEHWCIAVFVVLVAMALWSLLPYGYGLYHALVHENAAGQDAATNDGLKQALLALSAAAIPILTGILQKLAGNKRLIRKLVTVLLVLSGPLFFLVTFFVLTDLFIVPDGDALFDDKAKEAFMGVNGTTALWTAFIIIALYSGVLLNINFSSPHRYYRRQLSRTYLRRSEPGSEETKHEDPQRLTDLLQRDDKGLTKAPYHLINCALNIPACDDPNLRGRASDFFVFTKHFCGSPIVSYAPTAEWQDLDEALDLGTAMAISAAAASPQMGANTDSRFSFLLAILNVRLNYWVAAARRPSEPDTVRQPKWLLRWLSPGMWYFLKELTGLGMGENDFYLNLSDGGHVENLAIYELLRRRCKFIIAVDGEADPERTFHGLLTLVRLADIDLGVKINPNLEELRTDDAGNSRSHFLLCPIDYGRGQKGFLLYIKSSMSGNESEFLRKWRMEHPTFPHETTADQLFDESQFEAYRALGEHVAEELFLPEVTGSIQPDTPPLPAQPSVRAWFQGLANNLLEPNS